MVKKVCIFIHDEHLKYLSCTSSNVEDTCSNCFQKEKATRASSPGLKIALPLLKDAIGRGEVLTLSALAQRAHSEGYSIGYKTGYEQAQKEWERTHLIEAQNKDQSQ